ncbi:MAG: hypothetical protein RLZZ576_429 [Actinomycetota bacterium]
MVDWLYYSLLAVSFGSASLCLIAGMFGRKPSLLTMGSAVLTVQFVATIVLLVMGAQSKGDVVEFFGYVLVAMMVPAGAVVWALAERNRFSTLVLAVSGLTVAIMTARMAQIWGIA